MKVQDLLAFQIVPSVVTAFRGSWPEDMSPFQVQALRAGLLGQAEGGAPDLLVTGPLRCGRAELGELAAVHCAHSGQRVLFVLDSERTADATHRRLTARYGVLALRLRRVTEPMDDWLACGDFDVAVLSAEELLRQLAARPGLLGRVDLALVEGVDALCDRERGFPVELALTWLKRAQAALSHRRLRVCAFGDPAAGLRGLADTFGMQFVEAEPVAQATRLGVLCGTRFAYRSAETPEDGAPAEETLGDGPHPGLVGAVADLFRRGETVLLLAPDRARCLELAQALCAVLPRRRLPDAALAELALAEPGQPRELFTATLPHGVALHHADLAPGQRAWVEQAIRTGDVRVLLAVGTDELPPELRFGNVVHTERWAWHFSRRRRAWQRQDLTPRELDRSGEHARPASAHHAARVMLCAPSRIQAEVWQRDLVDAPLEGVQPTLLGQPLAEAALALIAGEACADAAEVKSFLLSSYTGRQCWWRTHARAQLVSQLESTVEELLALGLIERPDPARERLTASAFGRAVAATGLPLRTAALLGRWIDAAAACEFTALEVLLVLALSSSGATIHVPMLLAEQQSADYPGRLLEQAAALGALGTAATAGTAKPGRPVFRWLAERAGETGRALPLLTFEQARATKKALLLLDWVRAARGSQGEPERLALEARYDVWLGTARRAATGFARLAEALMRLCRARGWSSDRLQTIIRLSDQLRGEPGSTAGEEAERLTPSPRTSAVRQQLMALRAALAAQAQAQSGAAPGHAEAPGSAPRARRALLH